VTAEVVRKLPGDRGGAPARVDGSLQIVEAFRFPEGFDQDRIDVFNTNADRLAVFKLRLWETFGIDSKRYEGMWDFEEYVRLAEPAFYSLQALMSDEDVPCLLFAHEYMGMPAALQAILDGQQQFRTVFHAHECATARRLVEDHDGHDTMFYNVLRQARDDGLSGFILCEDDLDFSADFERRAPEAGRNGPT